MSKSVGAFLVMISAAMWGISGVFGQFLFEGRNIPVTEQFCLGPVGKILQFKNRRQILCFSMTNHQRFPLTLIHRFRCCGITDKTESDRL